MDASHAQGSDEGTPLLPVAMTVEGINRDIFMSISKGHQEEDVLAWSPHAEGISEMRPQETYKEASPRPPTPKFLPKPRGAEVLSHGANACPGELGWGASAADVQRQVGDRLVAGSVSGYERQSLLLVKGVIR